MTGLDVRREFDVAAPGYDLMVALNPGYHRHLRRASRELVARLPGTGPLRLWDLGCGSGASTAALAEQAGTRLHSLLGADLSEGMLARARAKRWPAGVRFVRARAEDLSTAAQVSSGAAGDGADDGGAPLDGVLAAYLFRNVAEPDRDATLRAVYDRLRPGGALVVQEYSVAHSRFATVIFTAVCWLIVVPLSVLTTRRTRLYRYLWRSVLAFDSPDRFVRRLLAAGFVDVRREGASGWQRDILHTFSARRPAADPSPAPERRT